MARHAAFGAVATVDEGTINNAIVSYARQLGPFFFPLPTPIPIGGLTSVTLGGIAEMLPRVIELHKDPNDRVTAHFILLSTLRAQLPGQSMKKWTIQWQESVKVGIVQRSSKNKSSLASTRHMSYSHRCK